MIYIEQFFINFWQILNEVSRYIIIGIFIMGLIRKYYFDKNVSQTYTPIKKENFFMDIWNYAYHKTLKDIAKPLLIGLVLAAMVSTFIPKKLLEEPSLLSVISSFFLITLLYKSLKRSQKPHCNCH